MAVNSGRLIAIFYVVLFVGLGTGAAVLFEDARQEYHQLKLTEAASRRRLADAEAKLAEQERILRRLQTDPAYLEKVLNQNGYARPNEFILRFPE